MIFTRPVKSTFKSRKNSYSYPTSVNISLLYYTFNLEFDIWNLLGASGGMAYTMDLKSIGFAAVRVRIPSRPFNSPGGIRSGANGAT